MWSVGHTDLPPVRPGSRVERFIERDSIKPPRIESRRADGDGAIKHRCTYFVSAENSKRPRRFKKFLSIGMTLRAVPRREPGVVLPDSRRMDQAPSPTLP